LKTLIKRAASTIKAFSDLAKNCSLCKKSEFIKEKTDFRHKKSVTGLEEANGQSPRAFLDSRTSLNSYSMMTCQFTSFRGSTKSKLGSARKSETGFKTFAP